MSGDSRRGWLKSSKGGKNLRLRRELRHVRTLLESVLEHLEYVELRLHSVSSPGLHE